MIPQSFSRRILLAAVAYSCCWLAYGFGQEASDVHVDPTVQWNFSKDFLRFENPPNPLTDLDENPIWFLLRTSQSEGPIESRTWLRDGRYVPLTEYDPRLFNEPITGWIFKKNPYLSPLAGRSTEPIPRGIHWDIGEMMVGPGPDHAIVIGWRSPFAGQIEIEGFFEHGQKGGVNSQVNWYVERGPAPAVDNGFQSRSLQAGHSDFGTDSQLGRFHIKDQTVQPGDFVYFIVDARADGTATCHYSDGTRFDVTITMRNTERPAPPKFEQDILPILASACFDCHGEDTQEAQLDLRTVTSILQGGENGHGIVLGEPDRSLLLDMLEQKQMPPAGSDPLTETQIGLIRRWIRAGAPADEQVVILPPRTILSEEDRQFWAFRSPMKMTLPTVPTSRQMRTPIDQMISHKLQEHGLMLSPDVDRATELRRAYFSLIGLPPSSSELDRFLADPQPDAWERLLDRLLASPQYGQRWGRHWLDTVGYVDNRLFDGDLGTIYENEQIWRYRDYVIRALNQDRPYDEFLTEQLAGDELVDWRNTPEFTPQIIDHLEATGFYRSIEDHTSEAQYGIPKRYEVVFDTMSMLSGVMGLTLECCRCHNHKFDPIPQRDYFRLMSLIEPALNPHQWLRPQERWLADVSLDKRQKIDKHNEGVQQQIKKLEEQSKAAETDGKETEVAQLKGKIQQLRQTLRSYSKIQALWDVGPAPRSRILRRGDPNSPGPAIEPGFPEILSNGRSTAAQRPIDTVGESSGLRLALARWLTEPDHPLTARVIVNRIWHHHFGRGIVETPGNFGRSGSSPTHPELLDWLTVDFIERGWSLKRLHKLIMTSTVFRQTSTDVFQSRAREVDPDNKLLWRMPLRRLEAEIIRDAVLAVSNRLDATPDGPPVKITNPVSGLSREKNSPTPTSHQRRSLYLFARRVYPLSFLEVFDSPIMPVNCTQRMTSATVLQSFTQLNDTFILEQAAAVAQQIQQLAPGDAEQQIQNAWKTVLSRKPDASEVERCREFLESQEAVYQDENSSAAEKSSLALKDLCHMLLCANEFLYIE